MVKEDLYVFFECQKSVGPPGPHPPLGREKRMEEATTERGPPPLTQTSRPSVVCLVKSLVQYSSQGTAGTTPAGLEGPFRFGGRPTNSAHEVSVLWARGRTTPRMDDHGQGDQMRPPDEMCSPLCSHERTYICQFRP